MPTDSPERDANRPSDHDSRLRTVVGRTQRRVPVTHPLMLTNDDASRRDDAPRPVTSKSHPETVLLVDDDDDLREMMRLWLRREHDWEVREASTGAEALEQLDDSVDVVVLDRKMPELSGPEVVDRLEGSTFDGNTVVVSAFRPDTHLASDDVADYLVKPVDRQDLVRALERQV